LSAERCDGTRGGPSSCRSQMPTEFADSNERGEFTM
jgi:hypothetical protein